MSKPSAGVGGIAVTVFALFAMLLSAGSASAACPNEVFRTGPSAKLPECRAYELVTPEYTGGIKPTGIASSNTFSGFEYPGITDAGDQLLYVTNGGALSGTEGNGWTASYVARRTANGWATDLYGPTTSQTPRGSLGGVSSDYEYYFVQAGFNGYTLFPEATLQAPFGGKPATYLRKPNGEFELVGKGSLGQAREVNGRLITPGATHVIFTSDTQLEPQAPPSGMTGIYDRTPGGPTHVVSLLPNGEAATDETKYLGASADGTDVAFATGEYVLSPARLGNVRLYVRRDNNDTVEVAGGSRLRVGKRLVCTGSGGTAVAYQWLREGVAIPGATEAGYTVTTADEGEGLQCQVTASSGEGQSLSVSIPPRVVMSDLAQSPPEPMSWSTPGLIQTAHYGYAEVGESVTCGAGEWSGSPSYAYQWFRNGAEIPGAGNATYSVVPADEGSALQCRVTATNADGTAVAFGPSAPVHATPPLATAAPTLSNLTDPGNAAETGDELSCSEGTWTESPSFSFKWLRNGAPIAGANASTYTVTPADEGKTLQCVVAATAGGLTMSATSNRLQVEPQPGATPPAPTEWSTPAMVWGTGEGGVVGESLYCYAGEWTGEPTFSYTWLRNGVEIAGADGENYVRSAADLGATVQCQVTATNAGGSFAAIYAGFGEPTIAHFPIAAASLPPAGVTYGGIFGGYLFYGDAAASLNGTMPSELYSYDIATGETTQITHVGDAQFSYVSKDGSRVYFVSQSSIGGEGNAGEPNLYVWSRSDDSTTYITTVEPDDVWRGLGLWVPAVGPGPKETTTGLGLANLRGTADGSTLLFETSAQLTSFNNVEAAPEDCGLPQYSGERCLEAYLYDADTGELTCVSCPPSNPGPATGDASFLHYQPGNFLSPPSNLSADGDTAIFESGEDLLPQDGNGRRDVYLWKRGSGLHLISTGQAISNSYIFAITPTASDIAFLTSEPLLPQDRNGGADRIYDARVNGGFPPPESTVTEPCSGDACQGNPSAAAAGPSVPSASLNGGGNVHPKLRCPKGKHRVVRHGKERCVKRQHRKHDRHHRRAGAKRGAAR